MTRERLEEIKHYWGVWFPEARNEARLALTAALEEAWAERQHLDVHWRSAEARAEKAEARRKEMEKLLAEWLRTPFFATEEDWRKWVDDYGPRVEAALRGEEEKE